MQEFFKKVAAVFWTGHDKTEEEKKHAELINLLSETKEELARCRRNLMFADSEALTDMYIYSIKAGEMRYAHLLRLAKETF